MLCSLLLRIVSARWCG
ncbi:hypothetical protein [Escherichia coli]|nr:hypothetical protein [Escherichia coli]